MSKGHYPCKKTDCIFFRLWYYVAGRVYQKSEEDPGMPNTTQWCIYCKEFKPFNFYIKETE
jgi:hypothetical protein